MNVTEQLSLIETPGHGATPVWSTLDAEQRALVVSVLVRLMARAVAHLREAAAGQENGRD